LFSFDTQLVERREIAEGTMAFYFARPAGFQFKPGQSLRITLIDPPETDAKGNARAFSIASAPAEDELMIATRMRDSAFKRVLRSMSPGAKVQIRGPVGRFVLDEDGTRPCVLIAGGIGITPFRSMLRHATAETSARKLYLFYGNRRPEDAAFLDELLELQARRPNYRLLATMAEMERSQLPWAGETGFIGKDLLARHVAELVEPAYYIAGPPAMVEAMQEMLIGAGVRAEDTHTDEFYGY
jgi:ferredoxin-NADP reductase